MTPNLTAAHIMDAASAHLNDVAKTKYTYAVQIPYLNTALRELEENFALDDVPVTKTLSAQLTIPIGNDISRVSTPALPSNFIEPIKVWEQINGAGFVPLTKVNTLIPDANITVNQFSVFTWDGGKIGLPIANGAIVVLLEYVGALFIPITASTDLIGVTNCQTFLEYRTAGLCAKDIDEDDARSNDLNGYAGIALERALGISVKGRQNIVTRRRPFRSSYRRG